MHFGGEKERHGEMCGGLENQNNKTIMQNSLDLVGFLQFTVFIVKTHIHPIAFDVYFHFEICPSQFCRSNRLIHLPLYSKISFSLRSINSGDRD
jgi:hypothetical protein